jgi:hypothetical protein
MNDMISIKTIKKHWSVIIQYLFWTTVFFAYTYISTDCLKNVNDLELSLNLINNLMENRVLQVGGVALCLYFVFLCVDRLLAVFANHDLKVGTHKIFDSIIKVTVVGSGSTISGVMYATTLYLLKNPQETQSFKEFFWVTTSFTFMIILLAVLCYWSLDKMKEEWGLELP